MSVQATSGPLAELSQFQIQCLLEIAEKGTPYGLEIKRGLQDYYGQDVNHGRLYPNLDDLKSKGLIRISSRDRRTNDYTLTDEGRRGLERYLKRCQAMLDGGEGDV